MNLKSLMVLSGLVLCVSSANAECFLDRASSYQCYFSKEISCSLKSDPSTGLGEKTLTLKYEYPDKVSYSYSTFVPGKCPSRNCGSDVQYVYEGSSDEAGKTGTVKNFNDQQLVTSIEGPNGLEFHAVLTNEPPKGLKSFVATKLQTLLIQGVSASGSAAQWYCH